MKTGNPDRPTTISGYERNPEAPDLMARLEDELARKAQALREIDERIAALPPMPDEVGESSNS